MVKVYVFEGKAEQALRVFKRRVLQEAILKSYKMSRVYEKPSERRVRLKAESQKRLRKMHAKTESRHFGC